MKLGAPSFIGDTAASPSLPDLISRKDLPLRHPWVYKLLPPPTSSSLRHVCSILCSSYIVCSNLEVPRCMLYFVCLTLYVFAVCLNLYAIRCISSLVCLILYILPRITHFVFLTLYTSSTYMFHHYTCLVVTCTNTRCTHLCITHQHWDATAVCVAVVTIYVTCSCTPNRHLLGYIDCYLRSIEIHEKEYTLRKACPWASLSLLPQHRPQSSHNSLAATSPSGPPNKPNPDEEVFVLLDFGDEPERKTKVAEFEKVMAVFGNYIVHPKVGPCFVYQSSLQFRDAENPPRIKCSTMNISG